MELTPTTNNNNSVFKRDPKNGNFIDITLQKQDTMKLINDKLLTPFFPNDLIKKSILYSALPNNCFVCRKNIIGHQQVIQLHLTGDLFFGVCHGCYVAFEIYQKDLFNVPGVFDFTDIPGFYIQQFHNFIVYRRSLPSRYKRRKKNI